LLVVAKRQTGNKLNMPNREKKRFCIIHQDNFLIFRGIKEKHDTAYMLVGFIVLNATFTIEYTWPEWGLNSQH
jgi:hypothetical protein